MPYDPFKRDHPQRAFHHRLLVSFVFSRSSGGGLDTVFSVKQISPSASTPGRTAGPTSPAISEMNELTHHRDSA